MQRRPAQRSPAGSADSPRRRRQPGRLPLRRGSAAELRLVVAATTRDDHAEDGALLLEDLAERDEHSANLAANSVAVVTQAEPRVSTAAVQRLADGYRPLTPPPSPSPTTRPRRRRSSATAPSAPAPNAPGSPPAPP